MPRTPLKEAVTLVEPPATAVSRPLALMVATAELPTVHVTFELTFAVEPSLYVAVAVNCCVSPAETFAEVGRTETTVKVFVGGGVVVTVEPGIPWQPVPATKSASSAGTSRHKTRLRRVACMDLLLPHVIVRSNATQLSVAFVLEGCRVPRLGLFSVTKLTSQHSLGLVPPTEKGIVFVFGIYRLSGTFEANIGSVSRGCKPDCGDG